MKDDNHKKKIGFSFGLDLITIDIPKKYRNEYLDIKVYIKILSEIKRKFDEIEYGELDTKYKDLIRTNLPSLVDEMSWKRWLYKWKRWNILRKLDNDVLKLKSPKINSLKHHLKQLEILDISIVWILKNILQSGIQDKIPELKYSIMAVLDAISGFRHSIILNKTWLLHGVFHWYKISEWIEINKEVLCGG